MDVQKVFVNPDNTAVVKCPHCGIARTVNVVERLRNRPDPWKIRCSCGSAFRVLFEIRKAHRKQTNLEGYYIKLPAGDDRGKMLVKNLSLTGIGFTTLTAHRLSKGDQVELRFNLDNVQRTGINRTAVVKNSDDRYVGCEFTGSTQYDKAFGFYLLS